MGERFSLVGAGQIEIGLFPAERALLEEVVAASDSAQTSLNVATTDDPGYRRLHVPVYLGDEASSDEWWRLVGSQLSSARAEDREVFAAAVTQDPPVVIDVAGAEAFLRVVNGARLVLAARLGIEVEDDFSGLSARDEAVLWFLSFVVNDLSDELTHSLPSPTEAQEDE